MASSMAFDRDAHIRYFKRCLTMLPEGYSAQQVTRLTVAFFCLSGLDVLNGLDMGDDERRQAIDWVYSHQVVADRDAPDKTSGLCGFRGSNWLGMPYDSSKTKSHFPNDEGHVAMTYCALLTLLILGDDFSRVQKRDIVRSLKTLQQDNGCFKSCHVGEECDIRFVYCACVISHLLDDWSGVDKAKAISFIRSCMGYDGAFGQGPALESHGGTTFCAVASLDLLGGVENVLTEDEQACLKAWLIARQQSGFQGRINKDADSCYSFWIGGALEILGSFDWVSRESLTKFILSCQSEAYGGFARQPDFYADALHTYFSVCGLSLLGHSGLRRLHATMNITQRAYQCRPHAVL